MSTHLQAVQALLSTYCLLFTILDLEGEDLLEGLGSDCVQLRRSASH